MFADTLLRTGLKLSALELEVVMGVTPRGSYCRDTLELSRLLDLYAMLGVPVQATLGYPSAADKAPHGDADQRVGLGWWRDGYSQAAQADWAAAFLSLVLCKPFVRAAYWTHLTDAEPHLFPNCGLVALDGTAKAALSELVRLRAGASEVTLPPRPPPTGGGIACQRRNPRRLSAAGVRSRPMIPENDPALRSFLDVPPASHFPIQNLPFGVFRRDGDEPHIGVAIGEWILDLAALQGAGLSSEPPAAGGGASRLPPLTREARWANTRSTA